MRTQRPGRRVLAMALSLALVAPMAVGGTASARARDGSGVDIPDRRPAEHPKLAPSLRDDLAARRAMPGAMARRAGVATGSAVTVVVEASDLRAARRAVSAAGGVVVEQVGKLTKARLPAGALGRLADARGIDIVREPERARVATTSDGVASSGAAAWQSAGHGGAGTKVAIVDIGFGDYASRLGSELPASVETDFGRCGSPFSLEHGTAVAEVVHDVAPDAALRLVCVEDDVDFASAVASLASNGIDVVNGSIGFVLTGRGDGSGAVGTPAAAVRSLRDDDGILYVAAAGNYGGRHASGTATGDPVPGNEYGTFVDLPGGDDRFTFVVAGDGVAAVALRWDSWGAAQDFDLFVTSGACGGLVGASTVDQTAGYPPIEYVEVANCDSIAHTFEVRINRWSGAATPRLDLFFDGDVTGIETATPGDVAEPATSPAVLTVGAHCWSGGALEAYSSTGPTIDARIKPDISGPDATSSSVFGASSGCSTGFRGTSASAPHVAGAAALLLGANPDLELAELEQLLTDRAVDAGAPGPDNQFGAGRLALGPAGDTTLRAAEPLSSVDPIRLFDSRPGALGASEAEFGAGGRTTPLPSKGSVRVRVAGVAGVPADATAVVLNVTVTKPTSSGYLTVHPGTVAPRASNLNFRSGQTVAQHVTATVGSDGKVQILNGSPGTTHVVVDLSGWYGPTGPSGPADDWFVPLAQPRRAMDTRAGTPGYAEASYGSSGRTAPIPAGGSLDVQVAGLGGVPSGARAVMLNVTVTAPTSGGYLLVYPTGATRPTASSLNFVTGQTVANLVVSRVGSAGRIRLQICCGAVHAIVDVTGWFQSGTGAGYVALAQPVRDIDTRYGNDYVKAPMKGVSIHNLTPRHYYGVPGDAVAVALSVIAVTPTATGYLQVYPDGTPPSTSTLNFTRGATVPNAVVCALGAQPYVDLRVVQSPSASVHLVSDLSGFFIDPADVGAPP